VLVLALATLAVAYAYQEFGKDALGDPQWRKYHGDSKPSDHVAPWQSGDVAKPKSIILRYFNIRGLAEPIRLTLALAGLDWDEVSYEKCPASGCPAGVEDWPTAKAAGIKSGLMPFGQVPSLSYEGDDGEKVDMAQSVAIVRYLGRKHGLYGLDQAVKTRHQSKKTDNQHTIDQIIGGARDFKSKYGKLVYNPETAKEGSEVLSHYKTKTVPTWVEHFSRIFRGEHSDPNFKGDWCCGVNVTIGDAVLWDVIDSNLRVDPTALDEHPKMADWFARFKELPSIATYLASDKRRKFANGGSAFFDTPNHPPAEKHTVL